MEIQTLEHRHIEACCRLFIDAFSHEPWNECYESDEEVRQYFVNFLALDNCLGFVGLEGKRLVALCIGMRKPWLKGMEYYIDQFCVSPSCQHRGIGSRFLAEIERRITKSGMAGLMLNTERAYPSCDFYRKNGFAVLEGLVVMGKEM